MLLALAIVNPPDALPAAALGGAPRGGGVRIAMVTEYAYPVLGGVPEHVHNLSQEMAARGPRRDRA